MAALDAFSATPIGPPPVVGYSVGVMEHTNTPDEHYIIPRPTPVVWTDGGIALLWHAVQEDK